MARVSPTTNTTWPNDAGFLALPGILSSSQVAAAVAALPALVGDVAVTGGTSDQELAGRDAAVDAFWSHPRVLEEVRRALGEQAELSRVVYRGPRPGLGLQALHVDHPFAVQPGAWVVCNAMVALVDFTASNGATRVVPGSQNSGRVPQRMQPQDTHPGEVRLLGPAGTVFLFLGHVWHSAAKNEGTVPRHSLLAGFCVPEARGFSHMQHTAPPPWLDANARRAWPVHASP